MACNDALANMDRLCRSLFVFVCKRELQRQSPSYECKMTQSTHVCCLVIDIGVSNWLRRQADIVFQPHAHTPFFAFVFILVLRFLIISEAISSQNTHHINYCGLSMLKTSPPLSVSNLESLDMIDVISSRHDNCPVHPNLKTYFFKLNLTRCL